MAQKRHILRYVPGGQSSHFKFEQRSRLEKALAKRDGGRVCFYCGKDQRLQVDHVVPPQFGGSDRIGNLVLACGTCNASKGQKPAWFFALRLIAMFPDVAERVRA